MQPNLWACIADEFDQRPSLNGEKIFLRIREIISFQDIAHFALTMIVLCTSTGLKKRNWGLLQSEITLPVP